MGSGEIDSGLAEFHGGYEITPMLLLSERLGFVIDSEFCEFRAKLIDAVKAGDEKAARELTESYSSSDEQLTVEREGVKLERVYLGFLLRKSLIMCDMERDYDYILGLEEAMEYAFAHGYRGVIPLIQKSKVEVLDVG